MQPDRTLSKWFNARPGGLALAIAGTVLLLAACQPSAPPPEPEAAPVEQPAPDPQPRPTFTQAQFEELLYGMTPAQVREVLGAEATRRESTYNEGANEYVAPSVTAWYIWENADGSFMKVGFVNEKLTEKVAEDLPAE